MDELVTQGEHAALVVEADLHRVRLRALLRGGQHVLQAILEPAHGTAEAHREQRDEHVLRVHDELGAEAAADVGGDDAHAVGRKIEQPQMNWRTWCGIWDDAHAVSPALSHGT